MNDTFDRRANPDELLRAIEREDEAGRRGHLKIFFGYAAGVGKTYAMLEAAHAAAARGVDVVIGYLEPHARPKTAALADGLPQIPVRETTSGGITYREFDLDATLERAPQLVLVDELAHTCAPGSRHQKRYQDVAELLRAGIDVYTTVNVQHIESLNDMVASITGVIVRERIPDHVFDDADQVELVDIEPADLIERLKAGDVYREAQANRALDNFFTVDNLAALREIALRRCADRMNLLSDEARAKSNRDYYTGEHVLVCVSPSATNPAIVRTAARMAAAFKARFTALYVQTPDEHELAGADAERLRANLALAEQLGAKVVSTSGDDVAYQIAEYSRLSGVSKLVMGRNTAGRTWLGRTGLADRLIALAPNLDIYIIPDRNRVRSQIHRRARMGRRRALVMPRVRDVVWTATLLALATGVGYLFMALGLNTENITSVYILATIVATVVTANLPCSIAMSAASVLLFNFCFVEPRYTLLFVPVYGPTFAVMFATAIMTSALTSHIGDQARQSALTAYRTKVLFDTSQLLGDAPGDERVFEITAEQLAKLLGRDVVMYPEDKDGRLGEPFLTWADDSVRDKAADDAVLSPSEAGVAAWVFKNNKHAGATTATLPDARCLYLAIRSHEQVFGVVGIVIDGRPLDAFENSTTLSVLGECALALESKRAAREREEAALLAKNEQLRANLLRSIGHDLRTPLTAISGAADVLLSEDLDIGRDKARELLGDIDGNARWLIGLVENLLAVTRIEDGSVQLNLTPELLDDVTCEAVRHLPHAADTHELCVHPTDDVLMSRMDARLITQVVVNLVDNALKYAPGGTRIDVTFRRDGDSVTCEVADAGPGVPDAEKDQVFDMFHTVNGVRPVDGRRSLGLGLALCHSIVEAHGGRIWVRDNHPCGAVFGFSLPAYDPMADDADAAHADATHPDVARADATRDDEGTDAEKGSTR